MSWRERRLLVAWIALTPLLYALGACRNKDTQTLNATENDSRLILQSYKSIDLENMRIINLSKARIQINETAFNYALDELLLGSGLREMSPENLVVKILPQNLLTDEDGTRHQTLIWERNGITTIGIAAGLDISRMTIDPDSATYSSKGLSVAFVHGALLVAVAMGKYSQEEAGQIYRNILAIYDNASMRDIPFKYPSNQFQDRMA